ncbi:MAG: hypothetical protein FWG64_07335 [Firmicutes bacterium]|nr:hypothetical protein [Bacillota bacterium]
MTKKFTKNFIFLAILHILGFFLILTISSCMPRHDWPPAGVYRSEFPPITLYLNPAYQNPFVSESIFLATYTVDEESHKILVNFLPGGAEPAFQIVTLDCFFAPGTSNNTQLWGGIYTVEDDILNFISGRGHDLSIFGVSETPGTIFFQKTEEYEPINPMDWFPEFEQYTGVWQSEDSSLILYLETAYQSPISPHFLGIYRTEQRERKVFTHITFHHTGERNLHMQLYDVSVLNVNKTMGERDSWFLPTPRQVVQWRPVLPNRFIRLEDGKLYYEHILFRDGVEDLRDTIILHRLHEYDRINPQNWILED